MGKHESKIITDGQGDFDLAKTKDVQEAGGGRHSDEDEGDKDDNEEDAGDDKE